MTTGSSSAHTAWWLTTCHGSPGSEQNVGLHRDAWLRQAWETMDIQAAALDLFKRLKLDADPQSKPILCNPLVFPLWDGVGKHLPFLILSLSKLAKFSGKVTGMSRFVSFHSSREEAAVVTTGIFDNYLTIFYQCKSIRILVLAARHLRCGHGSKLPWL